MDRADHMGATGVKTVLLKVALRGNAGLLEFVEYHDGTLAAHRDGAAIQQWPGTDFQQGLQSFTALQRQLESPNP
jgi:hypothetical protein